MAQPTKQTFTDDKFYLSKALHHLLIGKQHIEYLEIESTHNVKQFFRGCIHQVDNIISRFRKGMTDQGRKDFDESFIKGDTLFYDSISEKMLKLDEKQKPIVEFLVDALIRGEQVNIEVEDKSLLQTA